MFRRPISQYDSYVTPVWHTADCALASAAKEGVEQ